MSTSTVFVAGLMARYGTRFITERPPGEIYIHLLIAIVLDWHSRLTLCEVPLTPTPRAEASVLPSKCRDGPLDKRPEVIRCVLLEPVNGPYFGYVFTTN